MKFIFKAISKINGYLNRSSEFYKVAKSQSQPDCKMSCEGDSNCMVSTFLSEFNTCFLYKDLSEYNIKDLKKKKDDLFLTRSSDNLPSISEKQTLLILF